MMKIARAIAGALAAIGAIVAALAFTVLAMAAISAIWWVPLVVALVTWKALFG